LKRENIFDGGETTKEEDRKEIGRMYDTGKEWEYIIGKKNVQNSK